MKKQKDHIVKSKEGYSLKSKTTGKNLGGPYKTRGEAVKREQQVQYFKNKGLRKNGS